MAKLRSAGTFVSAAAVTTALWIAPVSFADDGHGHGDRDRGRDADQRAVVTAQAATVEDANDDREDDDAQAATAPVAPAAQQPAAADVSVSIANFSFVPASITVSAGQSVTFTNNDSARHTTTSSAWDSGDIQPGGTFTLTAPSQPGTFQYLCSIHPFMTGTLVVQ